MKKYIENLHRKENYRNSKTNKKYLPEKRAKNIVHTQNKKNKKKMLLLKKLTAKMSNESR